MSHVEQQLIMNRLPYPKYYDGIDFHTITSPTRKSIPKYLHQDLPNLKHQFIKEKFKEIGKFACPTLTYFNSLIKPQKINNKQTKKYSKREQRINKKEKELKNIEEELKYALIMSDKESNIIERLINRANDLQDELQAYKQKVSIKDINVPKTAVKKYGSVEKQQFSPTNHNQGNKLSIYDQGNLRKKKVRSMSLAKNTQFCFQDTVSIMFDYQKKQYFKKLREEISLKINPEIYDTVNRIKMIPFDKHSSYNQ